MAKEAVTKNSKKQAIEWLKSANDDLDSINYLIQAEHLTNIVAFHSQQAIEKSFKAILAFEDRRIPKKHDLFALHEIVKDDIRNIDSDLLFRINELYIESRYPGDIGLLPYGKPAISDAKEFYEYAINIFEKVCNILDIKIDDFK